MIASFLSTRYADLFTGLLFFVIALSMIAPRAASFAASVAGVVLFIAWWVGRGECLKPRAIELAFVVGFPALAGISALWAIDPPFAIERALKLLPLLLGALFFIEAARRQSAYGLPARTVRALMIFYIVLCAGIALEIFWGLKIYRFVNGITADQFTSIVLMNRSVVVASVVILPLMLMLYKSALAHKEKIALAGGASVSLLAALVQTESQSAQLFILLSLLFIFLFPVKKRLAWVMLGAATCACAFAAPWLAQLMFNLLPYEPGMENSGLMRAASIPHRMEIWNFIADEIMKHPWIGQGIEATRYIKSEHWLVLPNADNMLHPHNAPLQLWVEFGVLGITIGCALFVYILTRLWQAPLPGRRVGLAGLIAMLAVMSTGYGLWQSWQVGLILTFMGLMALAMGPPRTGKP